MIGKLREKYRLIEHKYPDSHCAESQSSNKWLQQKACHDFRMTCRAIMTTDTPCTVETTTKTLASSTRCSGMATGAPVLCVFPLWVWFWFQQHFVMHLWYSSHYTQILTRDLCVFSFVNVIVFNKVSFVLDRRWIKCARMRMNREWERGSKSQREEEKREA